MRYLNSAGSLCWVHHRAACWTCVRICAACTRPLATRIFFPQPSPRRWSTCPAATVLCTDLVQCGQMYVYTRDVAASCWVAEWGASVVASSAPVDVCLASCIFWISLRTSARIASCRWQVSRWRKRAKRRFVRWARRHTRAKAVHALHTCVPFCVYFRLCCQAVNSVRGLQSLHWEHCQQPCCLVVHSLQQRRSALRAFHAAAPNSASGFATPHLKQGFFISHVRHTRKKLHWRWRCFSGKFSSACHSLHTLRCRQTCSLSSRFHWPAVKAVAGLRSVQTEHARSSKYLASNACQLIASPRRCRSRRSRPRPIPFWNGAASKGRKISSFSRPWTRVMAT